MRSKNAAAAFFLVAENAEINPGSLKNINRIDADFFHVRIIGRGAAHKIQHLSRSLC